MADEDERCRPPATDPSRPEQSGQVATPVHLPAVGTGTIRDVAPREIQMREIPFLIVNTIRRRSAPERLADPKASTSRIRVEQRPDTKWSRACGGGSPWTPGGCSASG